MKIAFRVDSSKKIGLGHISRCITLAKEFKKRKIKIVFISKEIDSFSKNILKKFGLKLILINNNQSIKDDSLITADIIKRKKINLLFLDSYKLDLNWEKEIIKKTKLVFIDDLYNRKSLADFYINYHGYLYGNKFRKLKKNCKKLIGFEYVILKKNKNKKKKLSKKYIFAYFGNVDSKKLTSRLVDEINKKIFKNINFKILTKNKNLYKKIKKKNIKFISSNKSNLFLLMSNAKKIMTQGGLTLYEALNTEREVICYPTSKIQNKILKNLKLFFEIDVIKSFKNILYLIKKKSVNKKLPPSLIDDLGATRIVDYFTEKKVTPKLKKFTSKDLISLYSLRKDNLTQKNSFKNSNFNFSDHKKFFSKNKKKRKVFIFQSKNNFIGQVRLDKLKNNCYEIDYGINNIYRNNGFSRLILKKIVSNKFFLNSNFVAKVKSNNKPSIKNFKKLGFNCTSKNKNYLIFKK